MFLNKLARADVKEFVRVDLGNPVALFQQVPKFVEDDGAQSAIENNWGGMSGRNQHSAVFPGRLVDDLNRGIATAGGEHIEGIAPSQGVINALRDDVLVVAG